MPISQNAIDKAIADKKYDQHVGELYINAQRARDYHDRKFRRCIENWRYYVGLDAEYGLGQFSAKLVAYMNSQNRGLNTYNISKAYVDLVAGGIMQKPYDPEFYPVNEEVTSLTETAKNAMYSDKELCDWDTTYFEIVRAGLVFQAVAKIVIVSKYHPLGNIGLEMCLPNMWWPTPMWLSMYTRDCRECWEEVILMPDDVEEIYADRNPRISELVSAYKVSIPEYGTPNGPTPFLEGDEFRWGTALHLINRYRMVTQKVKKEFYLHPNGQIDIPQGTKDQPLDPRAKMDFLNQKLGPGQWDPYAIKETTEDKRVCIKTVICPTLSFQDVIDESPTEVQVDQVPFIVWSADRINGEPHSLIDLIKSPQDDINQGAARIRYKQEIDGGGGAQYYDPDGFESAEVAEDFKRNHNDPSKMFPVRPGLLADEGRVPSRPVQSAQFSPETYHWMEEILDVLLPHIYKSTAATRGEAQGKHEAAAMFQMKKQQSDQALYTIDYTLRQFWNQWFECYLLQAGQQYSIEGVERKFSSQGGKKMASFNEKIQLPGGGTGIKNDASQLLRMRHKVIISDIQQTPTKKLEDLQLLNDYLQNLMKFGQEKPATIIYILTRIAQLIDSFSPEDKEMLDVIGQKELENALLNLQITNIKLKASLSPPPQAVAPQAQLPAPQGAPAPAAPAPAAPPQPAPAAPAPAAAHGPGGPHARP